MKEVIEKWKEYKEHLSLKSKEYWNLYSNSFIDEVDGQRKFKAVDGTLIVVGSPNLLEKPTMEGFMDWLTSNP